MPTTTAERIAAEVRAELGRQGKSGSALATAVGMSQPAMSRRLRGEHAFDVTELQKVADFLAVPLSRLIAEAAA